GNGVTAIGDGVFGACCMTSVTIPENVTSVGEFGFAGCDTLEEVTFLGNEVTIEEYAFGECFSLKKITIPKKVVVGESAFESCTGLRDVYYGGTEEDWNKIIIDGTINGNGNDLLISVNIHYTVFVTGVSVEPTMLELRVGESGTLTATVVSENATNKNVSWTSSAPDVATVTDGVVTAVGEGETDITVTTEDGGKTATCKVTVAGFAVTGVSITPETLSLKVGESGTLTAAVVPENATNKNVSWTSSAPDVATVTDGVVTAVAEGETDITVTTEDGAKTATCRVTVAGFAVTGVSIAPETLSLKVGESGTLTAAVAPENATNKNVSWTSSAPAVVTVADGVVTAVSEGETDITVTTEDGGKTATCRVTVTKKAESTDPADPTEPDKPAEPEKPVEPEIPEGPLGPEKSDLSRYTASGNEIAVKSINLKKTVFKDVKGIKKFNVTAGDASAYKIKGSTLTVLKDATVTIEALNKKKEKLAEKTITVVAPAIDTAPPTEINRRGTLDLNKYILSTVQPFGWKTSNKKIAAVSENGLLLMKKSGTVKITVTFPSEKGMTAKKLTIKLKIKMPQFKKTTYTVKTGKTVKTAVKNAEAKDISYRIEDTAIARVDPTGSVTGVSKGTTKLIMTVKGIDYETKIKVK
nr:Ig-like domain-containing protein [Lachnospiraceae bacterium]